MTEPKTEQEIDQAREEFYQALKAIFQRLHGSTEQEGWRTGGTRQHYYKGDESFCHLPVIFSTLTAEAHPRTNPPRCKVCSHQVIDHLKRMAHPRTLEPMTPELEAITAQLRRAMRGMFLIKVITNKTAWERLIASAKEASGTEEANA